MNKMLYGCIFLLSYHCLNISEYREKIAIVAEQNGTAKMRKLLINRGRDVLNGIFSRKLVRMVNSTTS